MTKSGPTYRIQVKLKDKGSRKMNFYSTTWKLQIGMTPKQMEREVIVYADQYENNLRPLNFIILLFVCRIVLKNL